MKFLLVEDDERIASSLAEALTDNNYAVDIASDGEEGWDFITAFTYDLILLDLMLPKLNGIELCQRLRQRGYGLPILMLTARDSSTDKVLGLDAGADDYVIKPFDLKELLNRGSNATDDALGGGFIVVSKKRFCACKFAQNRNSHTYR